MLLCARRTVPAFWSGIKYVGHPHSHISALNAASAVTRPLPWASQRRSIKLYLYAKSKVLLGKQKILAFSPYTVPKFSRDHKVNLKFRKAIGRTTPEYEGAGDIDFWELRKQVKPGRMLYLCDAQNAGKITRYFSTLKNGDSSSLPRNYALVGPVRDRQQDAEKPSIESSKEAAEDGAAEPQLLGEDQDEAAEPQPLAQGRIRTIGPQAVKGAHFKLNSPDVYWQRMLAKSYEFIAKGSPVEFSIYFRAPKMARHEELLPMSNDLIDWAMLRFPHLRPDFILRGMPEGSVFMIRPVSNGRVVQFVIALKQIVPLMKASKLDERLKIKKEMVREAVQKGELLTGPALEYLRLKHPDFQRTEERHPEIERTKKDRSKLQRENKGALELRNTEEDVAPQKINNPSNPDKIFPWH